MTKSALLTGIRGEDGSYQAELLLAKGYGVRGIIRRYFNLKTPRLDAIFQDPHVPDRNLFLHFGERADSSELVNLLRDTGCSRRSAPPSSTPSITTRRPPSCTARPHGRRTSRPRSTPPSPYGVAKLYADWATVNYREAYGRFACNGMFNHEGPSRGETFVNRKITRAVARIKHGLQDKHYLGNTDAIRYWGYAPEYVERMWRMLHADVAPDYVLSTGVGATVQQLLEAVFAAADLEWEKYLELHPAYERPSEVDHLLGDPFKAERDLGWKAQTHWDEFARLMTAADGHDAVSQVVDDDGRQVIGR